MLFKDYFVIYYVEENLTQPTLLPLQEKNSQKRKKMGRHMHARLRRNSPLNYPNRLELQN